METQDFASMKRDELRKEAGKYGIENIKSLKKDELLAAVIKAAANTEKAVAANVALQISKGVFDVDATPETVPDVHSDSDVFGEFQLADTRAERRIERGPRFTKNTIGPSIAGKTLRHVRGKFVWRRGGSKSLRGAVIVPAGVPPMPPLKLKQEGRTFGPPPKSANYTGPSATLTVDLSGQAGPMSEYRRVLAYAAGRRSVKLTPAQVKRIRKNNNKHGWGDEDYAGFGQNNIASPNLSMIESR